jgi:hypothetical protein
MDTKASSSHSHPLRRPAEKSIWKCDVCSRGDQTGRLRCIAGCNFDICEACCSRTLIHRPTPPALTRNSPFHQHSLRNTTAVTRAERWRCDVRTARCTMPDPRPADSPRFTCDHGCNFDVCGDCIEIPSGPTALAPTHLHALCGFVCAQAWRCDDPECRKPGPFTGARLRCSVGCNFDMCWVCGARHGIPHLPVAATTPALAPAAVHVGPPGSPGPALRPPAGHTASGSPGPLRPVRPAPTPPLPAPGMVPGGPGDAPPPPYRRRRRALIIGIRCSLRCPPPPPPPPTSPSSTPIDAPSSADDSYEGTRHELRGCINDARSIFLLLTSRFNFATEDVRLLLQERGCVQPTRDNIQEVML